ncbi:hypothetical protein [Nocardia tenerifensis]|uniref:hypothetical protein n=1 Tax=Nocardia tenerifensis TaxID=228006 RepID=UPI000D754E3D|nr:hypothetical protein [Nocardia tenerifensis]
MLAPAADTVLTGMLRRPRCCSGRGAALTADAVLAVVFTSTVMLRRSPDCAGRDDVPTAVPRRSRCRMDGNAHLGRDAAPIAMLTPTVMRRPPRCGTDHHAALVAMLTPAADAVLTGMLRRP